MFIFRNIRRNIRNILCILASISSILIRPALGNGYPDGSWIFQSASKNGNSSRLPDGDVLLLNIRGTLGEITITPGNPGVVESIIKQFCTRLYGTGKITYMPMTQNAKTRIAKFDVSEVRGERNQGFCPAAQVLGQLTGKDISDQLENRSLKLDFHYNTVGNQLVLTTTFKNETVALTFKKHTP